MEFSKLIFIINTALVLFITIWGMWLFSVAVFNEITVDFTPVVTLFGVIYTEYGATTAFYYNKAKAENKLKLAKKYKIEIGKEDMTFEED